MIHSRPLVVSRKLARIAIVTVLVFCSLAGVSFSNLHKAEAALLEGRYQEAIETFEAVSKEVSTTRVYKGWVEALRITGQYEKALNQINAFDETDSTSKELENIRGEILYATGRFSKARRAFNKAISSRSSNYLLAEANLAILLYETGEVGEAFHRFDRLIDIYNSRVELGSQELIAVAIACRYKGLVDYKYFHDARMVLGEAQKMSPDSIEPILHTGALFLEKYDAGFAAQNFKAALLKNSVHPEALLGLAKVRVFDGANDGVELVEKALEVNPRYVAALAFRAEHFLVVEDYERARKEANKALLVNPYSSEALSILAAIAFLNGDSSGYEAAEKKILKRNPLHAGFYNKLAEIAVRNRMYSWAVQLATEATILDENSWLGYGLLGMNQLRLGEIQKGQSNLEHSFKGDPYNVWNKNVLELLDTYPSYEITKTEHFDLFIKNEESKLLSLLYGQVAEESYAKLVVKYKHRPSSRIRVEVFSSHEDFSVRTLGLPGLGALGVSFGPVVAVDSPSARPKGDFNWASTLWHELTHSITLEMTHNRVPRWFAEGLSVFEEHQARPGWGNDINIAFLKAYNRKALLPVSELNNGFVNPSEPQQISNSYYQAYLAIEFIAQDFGFQAILDMLLHYRDGRDTKDIFESVLGFSLFEFDEKFSLYLNKRFGERIAALKSIPEEELLSDYSDDIDLSAEREPSGFIATLETGQRALADGDYKKAEKFLKQAKELFPEYGGKDSPYLGLAKIYEANNKAELSALELARYVDINEIDYEAHIKLSQLYSSLGQTDKAIEILIRSLYIYPFDIAIHRKLASYYTKKERYVELILARQVILALTTNQAQGFYDLALAYHNSGDNQRAREELLKSLELAPSFQDALRLLLRLRNMND